MGRKYIYHQEKEVIVDVKFMSNEDQSKNCIPPKSFKTCYVYNWNVEK